MDAEPGLGCKENNSKTNKQSYVEAKRNRLTTHPFYATSKDTSINYGLEDQSGVGATERSASRTGALYTSAPYYDGAMAYIAPLKTDLIYKFTSLRSSR